MIGKVSSPIPTCTRRCGRKRSSVLVTIVFPAASDVGTHDWDVYSPMLFFTFSIVLE